MENDTREMIKKCTLFGIAITMAMSIGLKMPNKSFIGETGNDWIRILDVVAAAGIVLFLRMKYFPSEKYKGTILQVISICIGVLVMMAIMMFLTESITDNTARDLREGKPGEMWDVFWANVEASTDGLSLIKESAEEGDETVVSKTESQVWIGTIGIAILGILFTTIWQSVKNTIPPEAQVKLKKAFGWLFLLLLLAALGFVLWKSGIIPYLYHLVKPPAEETASLILSSFTA